MLRGKGRSETPAEGAVCLHNRWWTSSHMNCTYCIYLNKSFHVVLSHKALNLILKESCQRGRNCRWTSWSVFLGSNVTFFFFCNLDVFHSVCLVGATLKMCQHILTGATEEQILHFKWTISTKFRWVFFSQHQISQRSCKKGPVSQNCPAEMKIEFLSFPIPNPINTFKDEDMKRQTWT